jgi:ribosome-associated protein
MLVVSPDLKIPLREFQFTFARSSGPGGQNVNKVNSKATLRWSVVESGSLPEAVRRRLLARYRSQVTVTGELIVSSQRFRDAGRNVADCLGKLRSILLAVARPPTPRKPTRPTRGSRERRLSGKRLQADKKRGRQDFPRE